MTKLASKTIFIYSIKCFQYNTMSFHLRHSPCHSCMCRCCCRSYTSYSYVRLPSIYHIRVRLVVSLPLAIHSFLTDHAIRCILLLPLILFWYSSVCSFVSFHMIILFHMFVHRCDLKRGRYDSIRFAVSNCITSSYTYFKR